MNESLEPNLFPDIPKERPFECSECKKKIKVLYTEIIEESMTNTVMCADCPELNRRLHGLSKEEFGTEGILSQGLCCGNCGTTLEAIKTGHPLGCPVCYDVFQDVIFKDLLHEHRIAPRVAHLKPQETLHLGKFPTDGQSINPSTRLVALNEALQSTLAKEDYEQAALIRDQIKQLTEKDQNAN